LTLARKGIDMPLQSQAFRDDPKLQAASRDAAAHITPGAIGPHVAKIQHALNVLNAANLEEDGNYGRKTAAAVLAYKRRRNIVNTAYQTTADDIVGVMTISALDREMLALENQPLVYVDPRLLWRPIRPRPSDGRT
jgi:lysozyme family protein